MTSARGRKRGHADGAVNRGSDGEEASDTQVSARGSLTSRLLPGMHFSRTALTHGPGSSLPKARSLPQPEHGYGTRRSTQASHPGVAAGLAKRHKADIQAEATKKRAVGASKREKEEKKKADKAQRELKAAKTVAAMQDRRAQEEIEDIEFMDQTPPPVDDAMDGELFVQYLVVIAQDLEKLIFGNNNGSACPGRR